MKFKLYVVGEINEDSYKEFSEALSEIENKPGKDEAKNVEIELNSFGGSALDALAYYGRITRSKTTINVTVYGQVASAAVLILACCNKRRMIAESWLMVHEDESRLKERTSGFEQHARQMRREENQWSELLAKHTRTDSVTWLKLHKETTYLTATECLALGIVDEVI